MKLFLATVALAAATFLAACSEQVSSSEKPEQAATTEEKTTETKPTETTVEQTTEVKVEANMEENAAPEVASVEDELASPVPPQPSESQDSRSSLDWRTPSQKAGFNEAGQDVSNTPVISPEENAQRLPCLRAYYESLPPNQSGPESQRVTAEANAKGVTPYDVVGC